MGFNAAKIDLTKIHSLIDKIVINYQNELTYLNINATGRLGESANNYSVEYDNGVWTVYFRLPYYWEFVEHGRGPGRMPPVTAIEHWIDVKPVTITGNKRSVAFAIAHKIAREGTHPTWALRSALSNSIPILKEIETELARQIGQQVLVKIKTG